MTTITHIKRLKENSYKLGLSPLETRNAILKKMAKILLKEKKKIIEINNKDLIKAKSEDLYNPLYQRLVLSDSKIHQLIQGIFHLVNLPDPLGKIDFERELDSNLYLKKISVPIGVIGVIFESRPDALIQIITLCLKSGNACLIKGGKEAYNTNQFLFECVQSAIKEVDRELLEMFILLETREDIEKILNRDNEIDLIIPRGSKELVQYIKKNTNIPVLGHAEGLCHIYVDSSADFKKSLEVIYDSKTEYPSACNAVETLLIHWDIAKKFLPLLQKKMKEVKLLGDKEVQKIITVDLASENDWATEYGDLVLSIKIVKNVHEAISHIHFYDGNHTNSILCEDESIAKIFKDQVDSSAVFHNCSTRFCDGYVFGLGAEVGISTNKIHARGPVGLEGLTIYKYELVGNGHIKKPYTQNKRNFSHGKILSINHSLKGEA